MTNSELTILSLIAEAPRYGDEVQRLIDERGLREWVTVGFASVYYILNKLEKQNMVTSELRSDGRLPKRKYYHITEAGRGILQTAVSDLLRQPRAFGSGFELGLANLNVLKPRQVYQVLSQHHAELKTRLEAIETSWQKHQESEHPAEHIRALYTHSLAVMQAELAWFETFLSDWQQRYPGVDQPDPSQPTPAHRAPTQHSRPATPPPHKMIQKLKRPPKGE
ncbi:MAG: hypothetical protein CUN56_04935 [Phototrophicales bacterium]|nr:MAG: hypothetical protein CUN56_04935 [Phototrophicales bacterium]